MKLVFTGGHHTPALAVLEELYKLDSSVEIHWIGHKHSMLGDSSVSAEYQTITSLDIPFYNLKAGKVYKVRSFVQLLRIPFGLLQAFYYLSKIKPDLIVSFGGYLAPPVVIAGCFLGIPSVTHEQTVVAGWANKLTSRFAKKVFVSWQQSTQYFPQEKTILVGNPLRSAIFHSNPKVLAKFERFDRDPRPTIYITGGKQGSHTINQAVLEELPTLLKKFNIIHQCGGTSSYSDKENLLEACQNIKNQKEFVVNYVVQEYFGEDEIGTVFKLADFVVSRSGASSMYELAVLGKPAIFIPLPGSSHNEQEQNAKLFTSGGAGIIIDQEKLAGSSLLGACEKMVVDLEKYITKARELKTHILPDAGETLAREILVFGTRS